MTAVFTVDASKMLTLNVSIIDCVTVYRLLGLFLAYSLNVSIIDCVTAAPVTMEETV